MRYPAREYEDVSSRSWPNFFEKPRNFLLTKGPSIRGIQSGILRGRGSMKILVWPAIPPSFDLLFQNSVKQCAFGLRRFQFYMEYLIFW